MNASTPDPSTGVGVDEKSRTRLVISIGSNFVVCVFIIINNLLLLITLKRTPKLHTLPNIYIASLGVADLLVGVALVVRHFWLIPSTEWIFDQNEFVCLPFTCLLYVSGLESIFCLIWLSIERYLFIVWPFWHERHVTSRWIKWTITTSWLFSFICGCIPLFYNNFTRNKGCNATYIIPDSYIITFIIWIFTSASIIAIMYVQIIYVVRKQRKRISAETMQTHHTSTKSTTNLKSCKFFFLVCLLFYICWLPLLITTIVGLTHGTSILAISATVSLSAANSALNFIVFVILNKDFRLAFKAQLCGNQSVFSRTTNHKNNRTRNYNNDGTTNYNNNGTDHKLQQQRNQPQTTTIMEPTTSYNNNGTDH